MSEPSGLDAYFERIGYAGDASPTLATLRDIQRLHPERIPFENLDPLLGVRVSLDIPAIRDKLVTRHRGGYCYEHNLLLKHMLETMGFRVSGLAARVRWGVPEGVTLPLTHMLLRVEIDGRTWIVDVGFGGQVLTAPMLLEPGRVQPTPHENYRLMEDGDGYLLEWQLVDDWQTLYRFDLREQLLPDYELSNWYVSTHPASRFTTNLAVARTEPGRRYTLRNDSFAIHGTHGETDRRALTSVAEMKDLLRDCFRIPLPGHPDLDARLSRFLTAAN